MGEARLSKTELLGQNGVHAGLSPAIHYFVTRDFPSRVPWHRDIEVSKWPICAMTSALQ